VGRVTPRYDTLPTVRLRAWLVNAFILFHVVAIAAWSIPGAAQPAPVRALNRLLAPYMLRSGLWQGWDMFSPEPLSINVDLDAEVTFADGSQATWVFPRMERLGYLERYRKERYRKWRERVRLDAFALVWPDTARYVARLYDGPEHPVDRVALTRRWVEVTPPIGSRLVPRLDRVTPVHQYRFFVLSISPEDRR